MTGVHSGVLALLLEHHPALLSTDEVARAITAGDESPKARDDVDVAVRELVESGLAHRLDRFVFASHAAMSYRYFEAP